MNVQLSTFFFGIGSLRIEVAAFFSDSFNGKDDSDWNSIYDSLIKTIFHRNRKRWTENVQNRVKSGSRLKALPTHLFVILFLLTNLVQFPS